MELRGYFLHSLEKERDTNVFLIERALSSSRVTDSSSLFRTVEKHLLLKWLLGDTGKRHTLTNGAEAIPERETACGRCWVTGARESDI